MSFSSSGVANILDCPDDILIEIISWLYTNDHLAVANSCKRFKSIVFGTKTLTRDLDFSRRDKRTQPKEIAPYFSNSDTAENIVKLSLRSLNCVDPRVNLDISKAVNLVDLDIKGTRFTNMTNFVSFLKPLQYLKRLTVDWPIISKRSRNTLSVSFCKKLFQELLSRLEYLSIGISTITPAFFIMLNHCQELKELHVNKLASKRYNGYEYLPRKEWLRLDYLKVLHIYGCDLSCYEFIDFRNMIIQHRNWAEFRLNDRDNQPQSVSRDFYIEKNLQVCEELCEIKSQRNKDFGWSLIPEYLLKLVIMITHEDVPDEFCCFKCSDHNECRPILIRINEAKRLLLDPTYQISYLHFKHKLEYDCDAHLVASAFPNLTEIVLSDIVKTIKSVSTQSRKEILARRLRRRGCVVLERNNGPQKQDSSFEMLAKNTPLVTRLTIAGNMQYNEGLEEWDFHALYSIRLWKNLTVLRLKSIPIRDGSFFIDIGKECLNLEEMVLEDLGPGSSIYYMSGLCEMLRNCKNIREFSFHQYFIDDMCQLLDSLSNNSQLESVRFWTEPNIATDNSADVIQSIELLLGKCQEITTFTFVTHYRVDQGSLRRYEIIPNHDISNVNTGSYHRSMRHQNSSILSYIIIIFRIVHKLKRRNLRYSGPRVGRKHPVITTIPSLFDDLKYTSC